MIDKAFSLLYLLKIHFLYSIDKSQNQGCLTKNIKKRQGIKRCLAVFDRSL